MVYCVYNGCFRFRRCLVESGKIMKTYGKRCRLVFLFGLKLGRGNFGEGGRV